MSPTNARTTYTPNRAKCRRGYILLLVLFFLMVAALVISIPVNRLLRAGLECKERERMVQLRWARLSLQSCLLDRANQLLEAHNQGRKKNEPFQAIRRSIFLNNAEFHLTLADENTKLNLLIPIMLGQGEWAISAAEKLGSELDAETIGKLSDKYAISDPSVPIWPLRNWSVILKAGTIRSREDFQRLQIATSHITLWGDGTLNPNRAGLDVVKLRDSRPKSAGREPFSTASTQTNQSSCFSLWIVPDSEDGTGTLTIQWANNGASDRESFAW